MYRVGPAYAISDVIEGKYFYPRGTSGLPPPAFRSSNVSDVSARTRGTGGGDHDQVEAVEGGRDNGMGLTQRCKSFRSASIRSRADDDDRHRHPPRVQTLRCTTSTPTRSTSSSPDRIVRPLLPSPYNHAHRLIYLAQTAATHPRHSPSRPERSVQR